MHEFGSTRVLHIYIFMEDYLGHSLSDRPYFSCCRRWTELICAMKTEKNNVCTSVTPVWKSINQLINNQSEIESTMLFMVLTVNYDITMSIMSSVLWKVLFVYCMDRTLFMVDSGHLPPPPSPTPFSSEVYPRQPKKKSEVAWKDIDSKL